MQSPQKSIHTKLSEKFATSICGNDILSSALYVSGIAVVFAGIYAPFVLLAVVVVLFLYKAVYTEVVEALPVNGGAYNCLLNGTSKTVAAIAGIMTLLSYVATAVISAKVGIEYLRTIIPLDVLPATVILLLAFALLVVSGIKDSAKVAFGIFATHIVTLTIFLILALIFFFRVTVLSAKIYLQLVKFLPGKAVYCRGYFLHFQRVFWGCRVLKARQILWKSRDRVCFAKRFAIC